VYYNAAQGERAELLGVGLQGKLQTASQNDFDKKDCPLKYYGP
jgi:hypothetical protein